MPVPPVGAKERIERAELEPANVQLAGVVARWNEPADVRPPIGQARETRVDRYGDVRLERLPTRLHVARPDEPAVPLYAGRRVAMERIRPLVRPVQLRSLPVHPMPIEPRRAVEPIALVGPPAVHADVHERFMNRPVAGHLPIRRPFVVRRSARGKGRRGTWIG